MIPKTLVAIDLGGTNLRVYEVHPREAPDKVLGRNLLGETDIKTRTIATNKDLSKIVLIALDSNYKGKKPGVGISAAGDIDEDELVILTSPNLRIDGKITLGKDLKKAGYDTSESNDMRCAASGALRFGQGKGKNSFIIATYSSGHNIAKIENGKITTRSEFGHQPYNIRIEVPNWAKNLSCGCGGKGHLEPYVSGNGSSLMAKNFLKEYKDFKGILLYSVLKKYNKEKINLKETLNNERSRKKIIDSLDARDVYEAFRDCRTEEPQKTICKIQKNAIADSFGMMVSDFNPLELIICMGSMTKDWSETFDPAIKQYKKNIRSYHLSTLNSPEIVRNSVRKIGCVGAASYWLEQRGL